MELDNEEENERVAQSVRIQVLEKMCGKRDLKLALHEHDVKDLSLLLDCLNGSKPLTLGNKALGNLEVKGIVTHPNRMASDVKDFWDRSVRTCEDNDLRFTENISITVKKLWKPTKVTVFLLTTITQMHA